MFKNFVSYNSILSISYELRVLELPLLKPKGISGLSNILQRLFVQKNFSIAFSDILKSFRKKKKNFAVFNFVIERLSAKFSYAKTPSLKNGNWGKFEKIL